MIKIGILGGMSYQSTIHYYERINNIVNQALGGNYTADLIMTSENFQEIEELMNQNDWEAIAERLIIKAKGMKNMGASKIVIATNTIHKVARLIEDGAKIPVINIADCVANDINHAEIKKIGLIGTKVTMKESFIKDRLESHGLNVFTPTNEDTINRINEIIFKELCIGQITLESKQYFLKVFEYLKEKYSIEGMILGCTEIEMLIKKEDTMIPLFDTTQSHIDAISKIIIDSHIKTLK